jgi:hypothetical protein
VPEALQALSPGSPLSIIAAYTYLLEGLNPFASANLGGGYRVVVGVCVEV